MKDFETCSECGGDAFHRVGCRNYYGEDEGKEMLMKDAMMATQEKKIEELKTELKTYKEWLPDLEKYDHPVGWVAHLQESFSWGPSEVVFARSRIEALHLACNALDLEWEEMESSNFSLTREPRIDEYKREGEIPASVFREIGFYEEGSSTCDSCGLGTLWVRKGEYIGEVCEGCNQCDDCGCDCCPVCKESLDYENCEACGGDGYFTSYLKLKRRIRVLDNGEFEGVVWTPGQDFPGRDYESMMEAAVRDFIRTRKDSFVYMHAGQSVESVMAEIVLVSQVDQDIIVRGRLVGRTGKRMEGVWNVFTSKVVPFNLQVVGEGSTDDQGVSELVITRFEIDKEPYP